MDNARNPIVVGIDGSESSRGALRWAAHEAEVRGIPLRVIHAVGSPEPELWTAAKAMIADGVNEARSLAGSTAVTGEVIDGQPFTELCRAAETAEMVVVARRGIGGFDGLVLGSVSCQVALHAKSTVTIVDQVTSLPESARTEQSETGPAETRPAEAGAPTGELPVLVGTDSSAESDKAVGVAFAEAALHAAGLVAIRAWQPPLIVHRGEVRQPKLDWPVITKAAQYAITEDLAPWRERFPEVHVETRFMAHGPAASLVEASRNAQLLVIGSRGHGDFSGQRLGARTFQLLHHAQCPIMVVRCPEN